jgi:hypothetical protein
MEETVLEVEDTVSDGKVRHLNVEVKSFAFRDTDEKGVQDNKDKRDHSDDGKDVKP